MKSKRLNYFLSHADEAHLSAELVLAFPTLEFIDDLYWTTPMPPIRSSIDACSGNLVYLWNKAIFPKLPVIQAPDGLRFQGPSTHHVIQFGRNITRDGQMRYAQLSMSFDESNSEQKYFCEKVYRIVKKQHSHPLRCIESQSGKILRESINEIVVGKELAEAARHGLKLVLAFDSSETFEVMNG